MLIRVRPRLGRLSRDQLLTLCAVAKAHGNGQLDLTSRAAVQIRGVGADWTPALAPLVAAGLVDADPVREAAPALLVAPDWREGDDTHRIATTLLTRIGALPPLPGKIGIAIDAGAATVLGDAPADFRIERGVTGGLILRAEGRPAGVALPPGGEVAALVTLARWFVDTGGAVAGRMARHQAPLPSWASGTIRPALGDAPPVPGPHALGVAIGAPFGRIEADALQVIAGRDGIAGIRLTPWRIMIVEGGPPNLVPDEATTLLSADACVGMPACPQATVATRPLAARLAAFVSGSLHVSGCAKGCARARPAAIALTGRDGRFDLAFDAKAGGPPAAAGLTPDQLLALLERR